MKKQIISICAYCQHEFPALNSAVQKAEQNINFSHGVCLRHSVTMLKQIGRTPEQIIAFLKKNQQTPFLPDLSKHPELVKAYSQGNFHPQDMKERLKELANIKT